ncbi:MAG: hypothetical protein WAM60_17260 [Candidatus Promineifilaceae bacterium]
MLVPETRMGNRDERGTFRRIFCLILLGTAVLLLTSCGSGNDVPTRLPTADVAMAQTEIAVPPPTPTATPEPATIVLSSPADGVVLDLGQSVNLVVSASHPVGIRSISLTSNGQGIGTFQAVEQTSMEVNQPWTPNHAGFHHVIATLTSREGATISTEPITVKVVDRQLLAEYAPIFAEIEANVTEMRGLAPLKSVEPNLLTESELRQRLAAGFFYTQEEAHRDVLVLYAFDFTQRSFDLYNLTYRYLGENIAGFYDPQTEEFVVLSNDDEIDPLEKLYYAHEFMHALQDQHFQLDLLTDANQGYESGMAVRALAEGEATLVQELYVDYGYLTQNDIIDIFNVLVNIRPEESTDYYPLVLSNSFSFAYTTGYDFAATIFNRNGWQGLNNAWENVPQSTEQIIHPDRYFSGDAPVEVSLPLLDRTLGAGWQQVEEAVLGEFYLREYLGQRLRFDEVETAATGWGGDRFTVYWNEESDEIVLVLRNVWDTLVDSNQFVTGYGDYADLRFGTQRLSQPDGATCWHSIDYVCLYQVGGETLVVRAPSLEMVTEIAADIYSQ